MVLVERRDGDRRARSGGRGRKRVVDIDKTGEGPALRYGDGRDFRRRRRRSEDGHGRRSRLAAVGRRHGRADIGRNRRRREPAVRVDAPRRGRGHRPRRRNRLLRAVAPRRLAGIDRLATGRHAVRPGNRKRQQRPDRLHPALDARAPRAGIRSERIGRRLDEIPIRRVRRRRRVEIGRVRRPRAEFRLRARRGSRPRHAVVRCAGNRTPRHADAVRAVARRLDARRRGERNRHRYRSALRPRSGGVLRRDAVGIGDARRRRRVGEGRFRRREICRYAVCAARNDVTRSARNRVPCERDTARRGRDEAQARRRTRSRRRHGDRLRPGDRNALQRRVRGNHDVGIRRNRRCRHPSRAGDGAGGDLPRRRKRRLAPRPIGIERERRVRGRSARRNRAIALDGDRRGNDGDGTEPVVGNARRARAGSGGIRRGDDGIPVDRSRLRRRVGKLGSGNPARQRRCGAVERLGPEHAVARRPLDGVPRHLHEIDGGPVARRHVARRGKRPPTLHPRTEAARAGRILRLYEIPVVNTRRRGGVVVFRNRHPVDVLRVRRVVDRRTIDGVFRRPGGRGPVHANTG